MPANHSADEKIIKELDTQWGDAACKKDLEAVVALYAPDGSLVWPGAPAVHGTSNIRAAWVDFLKTPGLSLRFTPERIDFAHDADMAIDFGAVALERDDPQKGHVKMTAKYVVVWRKINGAWKVLYDCYNTNTPDA